MVSTDAGSPDRPRRRGCHFGSIVVDLERQQPLALLPDRHPATVIAWLQEHPAIEVVSRDRADGYAEAIRRGAPQAQQIANRWHILKNLGETLETWLHNKRVAIKAAVPAPRPTTVALEAIPILRGPNPKQEAARALRLARHREKYEQGYTKGSQKHDPRPGPIPAWGICPIAESFPS